MSRVYFVQVMICLKHSILISFYVFHTKSDRYFAINKLMQALRQSVCYKSYYIEI